MKKSTIHLTMGAMIAALYTVITVFVAAFGLANGAIQIRLSEALTILPIFTLDAVPGLFVGCIISNTITGCSIYDIIFGSITTLVAAILTRKLRNTKFLFYFPPILLNAIIVPIILKYAYKIGDAYLYLMITVGIGECISVMVFGYILKKMLTPFKDKLFNLYSVEKE